MTVYLEAGARLGPYEVVQLLGAGGMGEVYKARDPRLGREVAIKVLAPTLAQDKDALTRFEREAKTASALNHPHIVQIYEIGEAETPLGLARYIAMELVDGGTLRAKLRGGAGWGVLIGPLAQAADALARAHRAGIVHRDLKPENVMITPDGYPKLVDFGLAKLAELAPGLQGDPTTSLAGRTRTGMLVGTPSYMSPEQAQSKALDQRSDVFSFGCMLYEVATGRQAFRGDSSVATLHAIVYEEPAPIGSLNPEAPAELRRIIGRCMEKDPERRYQGMKDVGDDLRTLARGEVGTGAVPTTTHRRLPAVLRRPARRSLLAGGILILIVVGGVVGWRGRRKDGRVDATHPRSTIHIEKLTNRGDLNSAAVSPDGRYLVYSTSENGRHLVWRREIPEKSEMLLVDGIDGERLSLGFSGDGRSVFYSYAAKGGWVDYAVPLLGGAPRFLGEGGELSPNGGRRARTRANGGRWELILSDADGGSEKDLGDSSRYVPLDWTDDSSTLLFARKHDGSFWVVRADGTDERKVADLPIGHEAHAVWWRPDAKAFLAVVEEKPGLRALMSFDRATGAAVRVGQETWSELDGILWWPDGRGFVAMGWDKNRQRMWSVSYPEGTREPVPDDSNDYSDARLSADGRKLAALQSSERSDVLVSARLESGPFKKVAGGTDVSHSLCWTVEERVVYSANDSGSYDLYVVDADGSNRKQLTFDRTANETEPTASPDGRYVVFVSDRSGERGLHRVGTDGMGLMRLTTPEPGHGHRNPQFSPDSRWVVYQHWDNGPGVWKVSVDGGVTVLVKGARTGGTTGTEESAFGPGVSPDGRSLAFFYFTKDLATGDFSGMDIAISSLEGQIVRRFPYLESKHPMIGDDMRVQWSRDGRTLYYRLFADGTTNVWRRSVTGGPPVQVTHFAEPDRSRISTGRPTARCWLSRGPRPSPMPS